jgi:hypothetical protein
MYHRVAVSPLAAYDAFLERAADGLAATSSFGDVERLRFPWSRPYTRDEWLDQIRTGGNAKQLADAGKLTPILDGLATAIDTAGGSFQLDSVALALTATQL